VVATVDKEVRLDASAPGKNGNVRRWWCRGHTGFLALLVLLNLVLDHFAFRGETTIFLWSGILLAQTFLMGFWMALGGLHIVLRGVAVAGTTAAGALAVSVSSGVSQGDPDLFAVLFPLGGTIVLATYVLLLPLRLLPSWRVDFDRAYYARGSRRRMQLGLMDCINVVTSCAVLFGCARCLDRNLLSVAVIGGGFALFNSLPIALVVVVRRPSVKVWLLGASVLGASLIAEYVTAVYALDGEMGLLFPFEFGLVAMLLLNLLPLRFIFNLHLFSVSENAARELAAEAAERALAEVKAAWPTLPETIRAQIVALTRSKGAAGPVQPSTDLGS
jgi:hypothetical protein